ncbi:MAG: bifunctional hydroxymethylpyrimidine kinase/phosphomethylpyrimidine kinase [Bacteroidales bacterium]|nr:bifunctional hydroxymethylpyrimidine kinase/phosphomethylpyrimidine kinase [Bacteroidales bacterium]
MKEIKTVLTIAGSDSCGGAGIQADIKTISSLGLYAASAITAVTAQNTMGVRSIETVSPAMLSAQIEAVLEDFDVKAIKIGMIYNSENVTAIKKSLLKCNYQGPIVLDPVLVATSGDPLSSDNLINAMKTELFPMATIVTPNIPEAEALSGMEVKSIEEMRHAAKKIIADTGVKNVLVKGGHGLGNEMTDLLICSNGMERLFLNLRIETRNTHGTGCTLSSAIASYMTSIKPLRKAITQATIYVHKAIIHAKDLETGHGHGSLNHLFHPKEMITTEIVQTNVSSD